MSCNDEKLQAAWSCANSGTLEVRMIMAAVQDEDFIGILDYLSHDQSEYVQLLVAMNLCTTKETLQIILENNPPHSAIVREVAKKSLESVKDRKESIDRLNVDYTPLDTIPTKKLPQELEELIVFDCLD